MTIRVWLITGASGDYEEHREWPVECWKDKSNAEGRVKELHALVIEHREKREAFRSRYPWMSEPDDDGALYTKWRAATDRLKARYRRRARDAGFGDDDHTSYSVSPLPFRGEFKP